MVMKLDTPEFAKFTFSGQLELFGISVNIMLIKCHAIYQMSVVGLSW